MAPASGPVEIPVTKLLGLGTAAGLQLQITPPAKLAGVDNTLWTAGIDQTVIGNIRRPLKAIVVSQDPPAGTEVPFGTAVNITLASLDVIPLNILKDPAGLTFGTVGDFQAALTGDPTLMASVSNATSFDSLSAADQKAFTAFAAQHGAADASRAFGAAKIVASL
jgi:hypothetical protein